MSISEKLRAQGQYAAAVRWGHDPETIESAHRALATERIADYVERVLADAPPLTDAQLDRVGALLRLGGRQA